MLKGLLILILCTVFLGLAVPVSAQTCLPSDGSSANEVAWLTVVATSSDSQYLVRRQRYGIPSTQANKIYYVTDEAVCVAAAAAYQQAAGTQPSAGDRQVYVVKVGNVYVVRDPDEVNGEWGTSMVFDKNFNVLSAYTH